MIRLGDNNVDYGKIDNLECDNNSSLNICFTLLQMQISGCI